MSRPAVEVADILRAQGSRFLDRYESSFDYQQLKAFRAIQKCRTAALGGHLDSCPQCGYQAISYNSCRNRHCPKCQTQARERWIAKREQELLSTSYFHVVFTVPHELNVLALNNPREFYELLFRASAAAALELAADRKHLGAEIGMISILHTWGQNLLLHPHVHCLIPAGGLSADHGSWVHPRYPFFLPVKALSRVFRGKFVAGLKRLYRRRKLNCSGPAASLAAPKQFAKLLRRAHGQDWVVYAKPAFGGPSQVLRYLGRYTHRVAISNHRIVSFDGERVTFRYKDYAHGSKHRAMTPECGRVPSPLLLTRSTQGLRSHPSLRFPRQSVANSSPCDLSRAFGLQDKHRSDRPDSGTGPYFVAMPPMRHSHACGPAVYRCRTILPEGFL